MEPALPAPESMPVLKALLRLAPKGDALVDLWRDYAKLQDERSESFASSFGSAAEEAETDAEELLGKLREDPELLDTLLAAIEAALRTSSEEKRAYLARAVVGGALARDRSLVDLSALLVRALDQLEAVDIRLLISLRRRNDDELAMVPSDHQEVSDMLPARLTAGAIVEFPGYTAWTAASQDAVVARLVQVGVLQPVEHGHLVDDEVPWVEYRTEWHLTAFGHELLEFLHEGGDI